MNALADLTLKHIPLVCHAMNALAYLTLNQIPSGAKSG